MKTDIAELLNDFANWLDSNPDCTADNLVETYLSNMVKKEAPRIPENPDLDAIGEWVGLHYLVNFSTEPESKRKEWIERYYALSPELQYIHIIVAELATTEECVQDSQEWSEIQTMIDGGFTSGFNRCNNGRFSFDIATI